MADCRVAIVYIFTPLYMAGWNGDAEYMCASLKLSICGRMTPCYVSISVFVDSYEANL